MYENACKTVTPWTYYFFLPSRVAGRLDSMPKTGLLASHLGLIKLYLKKTSVVKVKYF